MSLTPLTLLLKNGIFLPVCRQEGEVANTTWWVGIQGGWVWHPGLKMTNAKGVLHVSIPARTQTRPSRWGGGVLAVGRHSKQMPPVPGLGSFAAFWTPGPKSLGLCGQPT